MIGSYLIALEAQDKQIVESSPRHGPQSQSSAPFSPQASRTRTARARTTNRDLPSPTTRKESVRDLVAPTTSGNLTPFVDTANPSSKTVVCVEGVLTADPASRRDSSLLHPIPTNRREPVERARGYRTDTASSASPLRQPRTLLRPRSALTSRPPTSRERRPPWRAPHSTSLPLTKTTAVLLLVSLLAHVTPPT